MQALVNETEKMLAILKGNELRDAGLIASAQKLEHYEIAAYGTAAALAGQLDLREEERQSQSDKADSNGILISDSEFFEVYPLTCSSDPELAAGRPRSRTAAERRERTFACSSMSALPRSGLPSLSARW